MFWMRNDSGFGNIEACCMFVKSGLDALTKSKKERIVVDAVV
jgi:hypothetical protein